MRNTSRKQARSFDFAQDDSLGSLDYCLIARRVRPVSIVRASHCGDHGVMAKLLLSRALETAIGVCTDAESVLAVRPQPNTCTKNRSSNQVRVRMTPRGRWKIGSCDFYGNFHGRFFVSGLRNL